MVPNKNLPGSGFRRCGFPPGRYCRAGFHGEFGHEVQGRSDTELSTGAIWVRPVAPQAEFQGERFRDIGSSRLCNHGAITRPRIPQDRRTALKDTPHDISQATLPRLRARRRYNKRMFRYKNKAGISWGLLSLFIALPIVLSQPPLLAQGFVAVVSNPTEVAKNESISALWNPSFCRVRRLCGTG